MDDIDDETSIPLFEEIRLDTKPEEELVITSSPKMETDFIDTKIEKHPNNKLAQILMKIEPVLENIENE